MYIPPDGKRKTAFPQLSSLVFARLGFALFGRSVFGLVVGLVAFVRVVIVVRVFECTGSQDGLLRLVECNGAELFPVRDQRVFGHDFVEGEFTLFACGQQCSKRVESRTAEIKSGRVLGRNGGKQGE